MEKKMIWSSEMFYDDEARENYLENMRAITGNKDYQLTDEEWADEVYLGLSDERGNLDKKVNGIIIAFADLGLWQGRRMLFRFLVTTLPTYFIPDARMPNGTAMPTTYVEYCATMTAPTMCFTA